jgi:glycosyltransferase involved in cell wall biosynthesis
MRILVISNLYPPVQVGGYELRCADTVGRLEREHEVLVLTSRHRRRTAPRRRQVLRALPFLPEDWRGTLCAPLASLWAARTVRRLLSRFRPELVFVWNASQIPRAAVLIAERHGAPVLYSIADPWFAAFVSGDQFLRYLDERDRGAHRVWGALVRLVNRLPWLRVDARAPRRMWIVWNSHALRAITPLPAGVQSVEERVIYPSTDGHERFASVERAPDPQPTIAFVGRLEPQKAPDVAVRALALLRERHGIDARLLIAGPGNGARGRALQQLAASLGVQERVELCGQLELEDVARLLARAHALVVPSRWQEPFGLVCLEGALARVPVVAAHSGGMPEMLESEREALFFPIDDVPACARALARTLNEPDATARRVRAAFERARSYSIERYHAEYDALVRDVARAGAAAGARAGAGAER